MSEPISIIVIPRTTVVDVRLTCGPHRDAYTSYIITDGKLTHQLTMSGQFSPWATESGELLPVFRTLIENVLPTLKHGEMTTLTYPPAGKQLYQISVQEHREVACRYLIEA